MLVQFISQNMLPTAHQGIYFLEGSKSSTHYLGDKNRFDVLQSRSTIVITVPSILRKVNHNLDGTANTGNKTTCIAKILKRMLVICTGNSRQPLNYWKESPSY